MIHVELLRMVRRPRTWMNLILLCALPIIVAVFIAVTNLVPAPGQGPAFLSAVLSDGSLYPEDNAARVDDWNAIVGNMLTAHPAVARLDLTTLADALRSDGPTSSTSIS